MNFFPLFFTHTGFLIEWNSIKKLTHQFLLPLPVLNVLLHTAKEIHMRVEILWLGHGREKQHHTQSIPNLRLDKSAEIIIKIKNALDENFTKILTCLIELGSTPDLLSPGIVLCNAWNSLSNKVGQAVSSSSIRAASYPETTKNSVTSFCV